jgi:hypothetical protein
LTKRLKIVGIIMLFTLLSCAVDKPAEPMCRVNEEKAEEIQGNAACLIRIQNQLLVTLGHSTDNYSLPGGKSKKNESAQCTAHRQTWAKTGFNVLVGEYLAIGNEGLRYYQCTLGGNFVGQIQSFPVPEWASAKVASIQLIDPFESHRNEWASPGQLIMLRDMFNRVEVE